MHELLCTAGVIERWVCVCANDIGIPGTTCGVRTNDKHCARRAAYMIIYRTFLHTIAPASQCGNGGLLIIDLVRIAPHYAGAPGPGPRHVVTAQAHTALSQVVGATVGYHWQ